MTGSSICRSAIALGALIVCDVTAHALDPGRAMSQYLRDRWDGDTAFPGGAVYSITQGRDGYLWIAAEKGLVRFDGVRFHVVQPDEMTTGADSTVVGLLTDGGGNLWALLRRAALARVRGNRFEHMVISKERPNAMVTAMAATAAGGVVAVDVSRGLLAERSGQFEVVVERGALPASFVISIAQTGDGVLWLGTRDSGLLRVEGGRPTAIADGLPDQKVNTLLARRRTAELWIGTDAGMAIWNGSTITQAGVPAGLDQLRVLSMLEDRDSNLWIGTAENGLFRVDPRGRMTRAADPAHQRETVAALYEDRDGNLWVGTNSGLERWRDAVFTTYSATEGLPTERIGAVYADANARTWFAPLDGGLFYLRDGTVVPVVEDGLDHDVVYAIAGNADGVWIGRQRGGLTRIPLHGDGRARRYTQTDGLAQNSVYAIHAARDGAIWAGTLSGGVSRFHAGAFTTYTAAHGLASNMVAAITETSDGAMWFATPNGVSRFAGGEWRRFAVAEGLPANEVTTLLPDRTEPRVWIGTAAGLAFIDLHGVHQVPLPTRDAVLSLIEDASGALWIVTANRILRANRDQLAAGRLEAREFALADGLLSRQGVKRASAISLDARGRVWIATPRGLSVADPATTSRAAPGLVQIEEVSADGSIADRERPIEIAPRPQRIRFVYAGLSLAVPERIAFRYRLDGFDVDWSESSTRREAEYTNLGPGRYRFRVTASNSDGVWSNSEAVVPFEVRPAVWQTRPFQGGLVGLAALAGWGAYRIRMRIAERHQRDISALNERLMNAQEQERVRIAGELHDGVMQEMLAATMMLGTAKRHTPDDSPAHSTIDKVQQKLIRVGTDLRQLSHELHPPALQEAGLPKAVQDYCEEFSTGSGIPVSCETDPGVDDLSRGTSLALFRVLQEALGNAAKHAQATRITVRLERNADLVSLVIADDGVGFDRSQLTPTRGLGLITIRERAAQLNGRFECDSAPGRGTTLKVVIPFR